MRRYQIRKPQNVSFSIDYEKELNAEQLQVVMAPLKPLLVLAGAGSGKTRVLVYRLARMIELGLVPCQIRLLTFTNRAAKSMLERVGTLCGNEARDIIGGTFHAVAMKDLQRYAEKLGYTSKFTVIGRDDAKDLMTVLRAERAMEELPTPEVVLEMISLALNTQTPIDQVILERFRRFYELSDVIGQLARIFFERKLAMNVMDFDDLLANWYALLREHDDVASELQSEIKAVLVDEYQDTNKLQSEIVKLLAKSCENVTVVGDDAQSIYAFRGATVHNILEFEKHYTEATALTLLTNYRSTPEILALSNESRKFAKEGFQKKLIAARLKGDIPAVVGCRDVNMQANFVAQRILELKADGVALDDVAVLYRAHHHAMELQLELMRRQIPFVVRSGLRFFEQAHIKDVLAYLRFAYNTKDEISFRRAARHHEGIGPLIAQKLWQMIVKGNDAMLVIASVAKQSSLESELENGLLRYARNDEPGNLGKCCAVLSGAKLSMKASKGLATFVNVLGSLTQSTSGAMIRALLDVFYESHAMANFTNGQQRCDDIKQLANYADSFGSMEKFLSELMLLSEFGVEELPSNDAEADLRKVTLSSVHQAKGLEWSQVFVLWMTEGRFPSELALREANGLEEERRLFYVAATRAKDALYLVHPQVARQSDWRQIMLRRSRFIEEVTTLSDTWVVEDEARDEHQRAQL